MTKVYGTNAFQFPLYCVIASTKRQGLEVQGKQILCFFRGMKGKEERFFFVRKEKALFGLYPLHH
jgi:hypothetical protein